MHRLAVAFVSLGLIAFPTLARADHPHLHHALHDIKAAVKDLENASNKFGGHKAQAIKDLKHAADEIEQALEAVKDPLPANFTVKANVYKDYKDNKHLRHSNKAIKEAIEELKDSKGKFGGHRVKAIEALEEAQKQVKKCIESLK